MRDRNTTTNASDAKDNNVFGADYAKLGEQQYYKMYSIANMGNSKDNIHVFHDQDNPLECCIEVKDNQAP
jgi:hypothetical protein